MLIVTLANDAAPSGMRAAAVTVLQMRVLVCKQVARESGCHDVLQGDYWRHGCLSESLWQGWGGGRGQGAHTSHLCFVC